MAAALAVLVGLAGLSGCGLPSRTDPKYAGPAQSPAAAQGGQKSPPNPTDGLSTEALIGSFLQASVGANLGGAGAEPDANKEALDRLRRYMAPSLASSWKPAKPLVIVRDPDIKSVPGGSGRDTVALHLQPLGVLNENGEVTGWTQGPIDVTYATVLVGGQRRLEAVQAENLFISESGLREWYVQQPIYFWSSGNDDPQLVPDLRYMPSTLSRAKQVTETLRWLQNGPGQLVDNVATKWSASFEVKDNPVIEEADVRVNLSGKATAHSKDDLNRLARQIRWSLPDHAPVKLSIETQEAGANSDGYLDDNAAVEASQVDQTRYVVVNESVRTQALSLGVPENPVFVPGPDNTQVVSAAVNRQGARAALVRRIGSGTKAEQRLFVISPDRPMGNPPKYVATNVIGPRLSRPAWVNYPVRRLMVSDGTRLFAGRTDDSTELEPVELTGLPGAPVGAFAVSPEGRRIAFTSEQKLMVAPLLYENGKFSIGAPVQQVSTSLADNQAVGWLTETTLAVGGKPAARSAHPVGTNNSGPRYNIVAVTIDGAQEEPLPPNSRQDATAEVTELTVRVNRPGFPTEFLILFEANGLAQRMYSSNSEPLFPVTEASPAANPGVIPTSPFFAD